MGCVSSYADFEKFVEVWEKSETLLEVAEKLGIGKTQASVRAGRYRREGIPLKYYGRRTKLDKLAVLAKVRGVNKEALTEDLESSLRNSISTEKLTGVELRLPPESEKSID